MDRSEFYSTQAGRRIDAPRSSRARFAIGDIVRHRKHGFRGVIFDIDPVYANSDEWFAQIPEGQRPQREQPFYHLLAENEDGTYIAYVSQQNLLIDIADEPIDHPQVEQLFEAFQGGRYHMRASLTH